MSKLIISVIRLLNFSDNIYNILELHRILLMRDFLFSVNIVSLKVN